MIFSPLGDSAVVVTLGSSPDESTLVKVRALAAAVEAGNYAEIVDVVPAYATVTVVYEPGAAMVGEATPYERVCRVVEKCAAKAEAAWPEAMAAVGIGGGGAREKRGAVEIPVSYGGKEFGPDLAEVARHCAVKEEDVIALHSGAEYTVLAVGFTPGFPYLGGLPAKLRTPRRATPRVSVPAGSVGIGWSQTGVYPLASPGGWQLIGRTPLKLFDLKRNAPALLRVGDRVQFRPITAEEFAKWK